MCSFSSNSKPDAQSMETFPPVLCPVSTIARKRGWLLILGRERVRFPVHLLCVSCMRKQNHPISERRCLALLDGVVKCRLLGIEDAPPQWIRREQSVPPRVPVRRVPGILRIVDHADGDDVLVWVIAGQDAPAAASRPTSASLA